MRTGSVGEDWLTRRGNWDWIYGEVGMLITGRRRVAAGVALVAATAGAEAITVVAAVQY